VRLGYDTRGRLASLAQGTGAEERVVSFAYDPLGNLASVTDPLLRTVSFQYDPAGRVIRQTLPDSRFIVFSRGTSESSRQKWSRSKWIIDIVGSRWIVRAAGCLLELEGPLHHAG
jgi:YD repeat-containing protein